MSTGDKILGKNDAGIVFERFDGTINFRLSEKALQSLLKGGPVVIKIDHIIKGVYVSAPLQRRGRCIKHKQQKRN